MSAFIQVYTYLDLARGRAITQEYVGASRQLKEGSRQQTSDGWALLSAGANPEDETVKEKRFEELVVI